MRPICQFSLRPGISTSKRSVDFSASCKSNMPATCWTRKESWIGQVTVAVMVGMVVRCRVSGVGCRMEIRGSQYSQHQHAAVAAVGSHALEDGALVGFIAAGDYDFVDARDRFLRRFGDRGRR